MWWLLRCNLERSHPWGAAQRVLAGSPKSWWVAVGAQMVCSSFSICLSILLLPFERIELSGAYKPCPKALVKICYRDVKNSYCWIIPETTKSLNDLSVPKMSRSLLLSGEGMPGTGRSQNVFSLLPPNSSSHWNLPWCQVLWKILIFTCSVVTHLNF